MEKVEQQKQIIKQYKEESELQPQQEGFDEQETSQINFLQTEMEIPEEVEYL